MNIVQVRGEDGALVTCLVAEGGARLRIIESERRGVYGLACAALAAGRTLEAEIDARLSDTSFDYAEMIADKRLLPPITHPDPAHCLVTGTGLTHLGSADTRDKMHKAATEAKAETLTDSMKMFRLGLEGGKPAAGAIGVAPEWFYKGTGASLVAPEGDLALPAFAEDGGEEPELAGIYLIAADGTPVCLGFALGNEYSDHVFERRNYLYLAHSKLRDSAIGPELRLGPAPHDIRGTSRIWRGPRMIFEKAFLTGEANMSHTLANLEHHHFKYPAHRRPGDLHIHYFGTATLSFAEGVRTESGDVFEISAEGFGKPLRNRLVAAKDEGLVRARFA